MSAVDRQQRLLEHQLRFEQQCAARLQRVVQQRDELAGQLRQLESYRTEYQISGSNAQQMNDTLVFLNRLDHSIGELRQHLARAEREVSSWRQRVQHASARTLAMQKLLDRTRSEHRRAMRNSERKSLDERIAGYAARGGLD
jgi:flagellar export protein FliJ